MSVNKPEACERCGLKTDDLVPPEDGDDSWSSKNWLCSSCHNSFLGNYG